MSRAISASFKAALHSQETDEVYIILITFDHADLDAPVRLTTDGVDTVSNGNTFVARPFELYLPDDTEDQPPTARITLSAVNRDLIASLRSISSPPSVLIQIVLSSAPDAVEASWPDLQLANITYNAGTISGQITLPALTRRTFPDIRFTPGRFPALFQQ